MKRKVVIAVLLGCTLFSSLGGAAYALNPPSPTPPPPAASFDDEMWVYYAEDEYMHWGPATYYGQPVLVHYTGPARAFFISRIHYFHYRTHGVAKVYEVNYYDPENPAAGAGNLIDERPFWCTLNYRDSQNDWGWPTRVWPGFAFGYVEFFYCKLTICGVYDFKATCWHGHWRVKSVAHTTPRIKGGMFPDEPPYKGYFPPP